MCSVWPTSRCGAIWTTRPAPRTQRASPQRSPTRTTKSTTFRGGPYAVPLQLNTGNAPTTWAARLAGIWLYDSRGQLDSLLDTGGAVHPMNRYSGMKKSVYVEMGLYKIGYKQLDAIRADQLPSGPVVVIV